MFFIVIANNRSLHKLTLSRNRCFLKYHTRLHPDELFLIHKLKVSIHTIHRILTGDSFLRKTIITCIKCTLEEVLNLIEPALNL